jgi:hypothetical protein
MTAPTTPAEILLAAAQHCEETGLWQGALWPGRGTYTPGDPCCAYGHISVAVGDLPDERVTANVLDVFSRYTQDTYGFMGCAWSDTPGRTATEVAEAMRAAAGRAEA